MSDLLKAMADLEGLVKPSGPAVDPVVSALAELESVTWGLQKSMAPRSVSSVPVPRTVASDVSTPMAKSAAAEASAYVATTWQRYQGDR